MTRSEIAVYSIAHNTYTNKTRAVSNLSRSKLDDIYYAMKTELRYTIDSNECDELVANMIAFASI